jgi:hypothetical protein
MDKLASPQELQAELRRLLAKCQEGQPSRKVMASELRALADRVSGLERGAPNVEGMLAGMMMDVATVVKRYASTGINTGHCTEQVAKVVIKHQPKFAAKGILIRDPSAVAEDLLYSVMKVEADYDMTAAKKVLDNYISKRVPATY